MEPTNPQPTSPLETPASDLSFLATTEPVPLNKDPKFTKPESKRLLSTNEGVGLTPAVEYVGSEPTPPTPIEPVEPSNPGTGGPIIILPPPVEPDNPGEGPVIILPPPVEPELPGDVVILPPPPIEPDIPGDNGDGGVVIVPPPIVVDPPVGGGVIIVPPPVVVDPPTGGGSGPIIILPPPVVLDPPTGGGVVILPPPVILDPPGGGSGPIIILPPPVVLDPPTGGGVVILPPPVVLDPPTGGGVIILPPPVVLDPPPTGGGVIIVPPPIVVDPPGGGSGPIIILPPPIVVDPPTGGGGPIIILPPPVVLDPPTGGGVIIVPPPIVVDPPGGGSGPIIILPPPVVLDPPGGGSGPIVILPPPIVVDPPGGGGVIILPPPVVLDPPPGGGGGVVILPPPIVLDPPGGGGGPILPPPIDPPPVDPPPVLDPPTLPLNIAPSTSMTLSSYGIRQGQFIFIDATGSDFDGTISFIRLNIEGVVTDIPGAILHEPYTPTSIGNKVITAQAFDNRGRGSDLIVSRTLIVSPTGIPPTINLTLDRSQIRVGESTVARMTATDPDGSVSSIILYIAGQVAGTSTSTPFNFLVSGLAVGNYSMYAQSMDNEGNYSSSSANRLISVLNSGVAPTGTLTASKTSGVDGDLIRFTAIGSDSDGIVNKIELFSGTTLLSTFNGDRNEFAQNFSTGNYSITAKFTDNNGLTFTTQAINISIAGLVSVPTIVISQDISSGVINEPVSISAIITDLTRRIILRTFKVNTVAGVIFTGSSYDYIPETPGTKNITVILTLNDGSSITSNSLVYTAIDINQPPIVSLTSSKSVIITGESIALTAITSGSSPISFVEFFKGLQLIGKVESAPWKLIYNGFSEGVSTVICKATDTRGLTGISNQLTITATDINTAPQITISSNRSSPSVGDSVIIAANVFDNENNLSHVELFYDNVFVTRRSVSPFSFIINNIQSGSHLVKCVATDAKGASTVSNIIQFNVQVPNTPPTLSISIYTPPTDTGIFYEVRSPISGDSISFEFSASDTNQGVPNKGVALLELLWNGQVVTTYTGTGQFSLIEVLDYRTEVTEFGTFEVQGRVTDIDGAVSLSNKIYIEVIDAYEYYKIITLTRVSPFEILEGSVVEFSYSLSPLSYSPNPLLIIDNQGNFYRGTDTGVTINYSAKTISIQSVNLPPTSSQIKVYDPSQGISSNFVSYHREGPQVYYTTFVEANDASFLTLMSYMSTVPSIVGLVFPESVTLPLGNAALKGTQSFKTIYIIYDYTKGSLSKVMCEGVDFYSDFPLIGMSHDFGDGILIPLGVAKLRNAVERTFNLSIHFDAYQEA